MGPKPAPPSPDADLGTPTKRARLEPRHRPYWTEVARGVHLGYRKADPEKAGVWYGRSFVSALGRYEQWKLGAADDRGALANGTSVLSHRQATDSLLRGRPHAVQVPKDSAAYTVEHAVREYLEYLETDKESAADAGARLSAYVTATPAGAVRLGATPLAHLTRDDLGRWRSWALTYSPPGRRNWAKYVRRADSAGELHARHKEARSHGQLTPLVIAAHERRRRELDGLVKPRKHGPAPTRPRPAAKVQDADEVRRRKKETLNKVINYLKAALNRAHEAGRVSSSQAWDGLQRFGGTSSARVRWLTLDEIPRLLNACDPVWRRAVEAGLATGCRWGELRRARVRDFDRHAATLLIPRSKNKKARHVPLSEEGRAFFDALAAGQDPGALLLASAEGKQYGTHDQARRMREASTAARLSSPAGFHTLRHTYASHLVQAGTPLLFVARALGHTDTRMVEKHYGHLAPDTVADSVRANLPKFGLATESNVRRLRA